MSHISMRARQHPRGLSARQSFIALLLPLALYGLATSQAQAADEVNDSQAQAVAQQILEDYRVERRLNVPRWATWAFDEGNGPTANCVRARNSTSRPVTYKDCAAEHAAVSEERWVEVLQSWAVLDASQKAQVTRLMQPLFSSLQNNPEISLSGRTVARAYVSGGGGGGLGGLSLGGINLGAVLGALGIQLDDGSTRLIETLLQGTFAQGGDILNDQIAAHTQGDVSTLTGDARSSNARFTKLPQDLVQKAGDHLVRSKFQVDSDKKQLAETAHVAGNSKNRAAAVKDITEKIQALGASGADQSTVQAKLAQYEFYLAALDALGREEQIKSAAQRQGERAQERLVSAAAEARSLEGAIRRAR